VVCCSYFPGNQTITRVRVIMFSALPVHNWTTQGNTWRMNNSSRKKCRGAYTGISFLDFGTISTQYCQNDKKGTEG